MQLTRLAEDYEKFKRAGAELVAISVDAQSFAWSMGQTTGAKFQILSDADKKTVTAYGILNAQEHGGIAKPSTFIVDRNGAIRFLYVGRDAGDRPEDSRVLEEVKKIVESK
jgi:peroxiredoxin